MIESKKEIKMSQTVKPYRLINIVKVHPVVTVCNPKENAPDIAKFKSQSKSMYVHISDLTFAM